MTAYAFYKEYRNKPASYIELFEFIKIKEIEGLVQEYADRLMEINNLKR